MKFAPQEPIPIADVPDARRVHLFHPERVPVAVDARLVWPGFILDDIRTAWHLATLSHAVYHEANDAQAAVRSLGWEWEARVERGGIRADIVRRGDEIVLCCCGTRPQEVQNLRCDVDAVLIEHPVAGRVHRGFAEAWAVLREDIKKWPPPTVATGHSLGGALALLAAAEFPDIGAIVFGSPRVGDKGFAKLAEGRAVMRYQAPADMVCQLPPERLGFAHFGRLAILANFVRQLDPSPSEIARLRRRSQWRFAARLPWLNPTALWFRELADHAIHNYCQLLAGTDC